MAVNIKYRAPNPVVHTDTTIKNSPLSNEEIDGNFKNVKDAIEVIQSTDGAAAVGFTPTGTVAATNVQSAINEVVSDLAAGTGASLVGYTPAGTGAVATTVQSKLRETVSVKDFGAIADGTSHPLSERFASLAAAQAEYPQASITSLTQQIDWAALQHAHVIASDLGKKLRVTNGDYYIGSDTWTINRSVNIEGDGHLAGGTYITYTGNDAAVRFRKDGFVAGNSSYWIYACNFKDIGIRRTGSGGVGVDLYGVSEAFFDRVSVGGVDTSNFDSAFRFTDCSIIGITTPVISYNSCAFNFASVAGDRNIVNASITISNGDFYRNAQMFRCNAVVGLNISEQNWIESCDAVFVFDDSYGTVEVSTIKFSENNVLFNTATAVGLVKASNTGTNLMRIINGSFTGNRLNYVYTLPGTVIPVDVRISATTDTNTKVELEFYQNLTFTTLAGLAYANSTKVYYRFVNNINLDASTLLASIPTFLSGVAGFACLAAETRTESGSTMVGANADRSVGSTLLVHQKTAATGFAIKAGDAQGTVSLFSLFDASGNFLGGVNFQGAFVSNADYLTVKGKRLYSLNGVPAFGSWSPGELLWNPDGSSGQTVALWKCVATGTGNSSFRQIAHEVRKGTTAQRPSLNPTSDIGVMYFDTTLAAAGKPIWYNGSAWVDATGSTV